jgi:adhesin HecA-like repeat protein
VAGFASLRLKVAALEPALQPYFYRAMNKLSPYYYQGDNIILEFDKHDKVTGKFIKHIYNTCNITSLSMTLEALGKTAADYKYQSLIPAVARVHNSDVQNRARDKVGSALTGLRLPDYVAMAAVVWQMGYKAGDDAAIMAASNAAFGAIPSPAAIKTLAGDFGVSATIGQLTLDAAGRMDNTSGQLSSYGETHWKAADTQAIEETRAGTARGRNAGALSNAAIERQIPLERYKQAALAQLGPLLDAGRQVVAGQFNHFVRLQSVDDEFVTKDDPGRYTGANEKATWEEARAMGLFTNWIVIG